MNFVKKYLFSIIACALGLVAILLLFTDCVKYSISGFGQELAINFSGFEAIFGYSENNKEIIGFSFGGLVALLLLVVAMVLSFVKIPMQNIIVGILFIVGGVMVMLIPNMVNADAKPTGEFVLYLSGILAILAGAVFAGAPYLLKKSK